MTIIYTDASCDEKLNICAWAYIIKTQTGKTLIQTGHYKGRKVISGEVLAIVKALGRCKSMSGKIQVYCDPLQISEAFSNRKKSHWRKWFKKVPAWAALWACLETYNLRLNISRVKRTENLAHSYAKGELKRLRAQLQGNRGCG